MLKKLANAQAELKTMTAKYNELKATCDTEGRIRKFGGKNSRVIL